MIPEFVLRHPIVRFLIAGGLNTLVTGALVSLLSLVIPGWLAFTIAFALGLAVSVVVTGLWVFRSSLTGARTALYIAAYLAIYGCGLLAVHLIEASGAPAWANGATVVLTAPLGFLAGRLIFTDSARKKAAP